MAPSGMRGAWWWIDRWRKSTAYTDMTLAEQGAYRNLLDELWLRGGVLPLDERILAKMSGDAVAWPSVRDAVLKRFERTPEGLRNSTHDEVSKESKRRAAKQKEYRERPRAGNARGNAAGNESLNVVPSPFTGSVSVLRSPSQSPDGTDERPGADAPVAPVLTLASVRKPANPEAEAAVRYWAERSETLVRSADVTRKYVARAAERIREGVTLDQLKAAVDGACNDKFYRDKGHHKNPHTIWLDFGRVQQLSAWKGNGDGKASAVDLYQGGLELLEGVRERNRNGQALDANVAARARLEAGGREGSGDPDAGVGTGAGRGE